MADSTPQPDSPAASLFAADDLRLGGSPWKRALSIAAALAVLASATALLIASISTPETGPELTYKITRGDLVVTVVEQGMLESSENTEIKCKVRGKNAVLWVIDSGTIVKPGDELVRLDSLFIEEQIDERTKFAHWSRSAAERSAANAKRAKLAVSEYEQGRYVAELMNLEKELTVAQSNLSSSESLLSFAELMANSKYKSELDVEEKQFARDQAELDVSLKETQLDVLKRFTNAEQMQTLNGNLASIEATHKANAERAMADASRRDRALQEVKHCVVRAERGGLVIHPNAAKWELRPIAEGSVVHKDQILLLMPDLTQMQVKVGIHESTVDRIKQGLKARVELPIRNLEGEVSSVSEVTRPASWWTGNEVRYDTLVKLPSVDGLRPGMSAEVEIIIAEYEDVLMIPVAAVVSLSSGDYCWVKTAEGATEQRAIILGDSNDVHTIISQGLKEGDEVVLNPLGIREAQEAVQADAELDPKAPDAQSPAPAAKPDAGAD